MKRDDENTSSAREEPAQDDPMNSGLNVAERDLLKQWLHELPDTPPPRAVWQRIRAQADAEGLARRGPVLRPWLAAGAGIAAAVLLAVFALPPGAPPGDGGPFPTEPAWQGDAGNRTALEALQVRSRLLERDLRALPAAPNVVRAGTAVTIGDLEDRIAAIDHALSDPDAALSAEQTEQYWRERVRLMDSLVQVRYAQARRHSM